ncbi:MAG: bifunctional oligoribonuclease/PAP phosphatase NrnA [Candidatus Omnitrophica bacterium]|nr:bifunctional oligoribonuclease/PAP phosphatase NrnA [Candidatus Omnitrophota bacterium]
MSNLRTIKERIFKAKDFVIACHRNPDGDCIGSLLALGLGLKTLKKRVIMVSQDGVPLSYRGLPGANKITRRLGKVPDMAITVDCNSKEMVGRPFKTIRKAKYLLEIDHHEFREPYGNMFLIDTKAASVGEMVYKLLYYLRIGITKEIAENILTSIIVETNSFRLPTVKPATFNICYKLQKTGVDFHKISETVYWSKTKQAVILSGICMSKLEFSRNGQIAWSIVSKKDFSSVKGRDEDVDPVANDILAIKAIKIAVLFREKSQNILRVSLRAKGGINVASLAYKYGGGGHFDSAGCQITNTKKEIRGFIEAAKRLLR